MLPYTAPGSSVVQLRELPITLTSPLPVRSCVAPPSVPASSTPLAPMPLWPSMAMPPAPVLRLLPRTSTPSELT